jgi:hypothetical protein
MKASLATLLALAGAAAAQPTLTTLGGGLPLRVSSNLGGTYYIGGTSTASGAARWTLVGSSLSVTDLGSSGGGYMSADGSSVTGLLANDTARIFGNTATGVSPAYRPDPTLIPSTTQPAATETLGAVWSASTGTWRRMSGLPIVGSLHVFGSGSGGSSTGSFITPNGISADGRYTVGLAYISTYNNAGTSVSANSFRWRAFVHDAQGNGGAGSMTVLPTPNKTTTGQTSLFRTGNAYAVSADGGVIVGATEHNAGVAPGPNADGGRLAVWTRNGSGAYVMSYLDTGTDANGFPKYMTSTPGSMTINAAGTIIAARGPDGITKWVWNGSSWGSPIVLGSNLTTPASWLPIAVTNCGAPPTLGGSLSMSDDGNTIVGSAVYSTCGSFMSGGFIWTSADGVLTDWYDYNVALGTPGVGPGGSYGPIGDNGDPTKGLPILGYPTSISADGTAIVGFQGGTQRIPGAPTWIWLASGGPSCVAPAITLQPAASTPVSACTSSIILGVTASGTGPFTYQWYKDGQPLFDGTTSSGSTISGATSFQLRVNPPLSPSDLGTYSAVVNGQCGTPAVTSNASVILDPTATPAANDTCATAQAVTMGTNVLGASGQGACGAFVNDANNSSSCLATGMKADRWYSFTPATGGDYRLETCGSNFDTLLSVYDGCGATELACNDNYLTGPSTGCSSNRSRIASLPMNAGQTYLIRVSAPLAAFLSSTSTMNMSITAAPAPAANDSCFTATNAIEGANAFDTTEATNDTIATCATAASRDVWFSFTAQGRGRARLATCPGTTLNTVLSVYDACFGNELACNDNASITGCSNQSIISDVQMVDGQSVLIRVATNMATTFGAGTLNVEFVCIADFNVDGGVDGGDIASFFGAWESGNSSADANLDGGIDGSDVEVFFWYWEGGGC